MDDITRLLAEQHIKEYDMRLARLDALLEQAQGKLAQSATPEEHRVQLANLRQQRDQLATWLTESHAHLPENWQEEEIRKAGPMGLWDAVAQQIEGLIERMER